MVRKIFFSLFFLKRVGLTYIFPLKGEGGGNQVNSIVT